MLEFYHRLRQAQKAVADIFLTSLSACGILACVWERAKNDRFAPDAI
jgi:hypothetical protein